MKHSTFMCNICRKSIHAFIADALPDVQIDGVCLSSQLNTIGNVRHFERASADDAEVHICIPCYRGIKEHLTAAD